MEQPVAENAANGSISELHENEFDGVMDGRKQDSAEVRSKRQLTTRHLFGVLVFAGIFSASARTAWPDYLAVVWAGLLTYFVYSSARQVKLLVTKQDGLFQDCHGSARWSWIACRTLGALLLTFVLLNPFDVMTRSGRVVLRTRVKRSLSAGRGNRPPAWPDSLNPDTVSLGNPAFMMSGGLLPSCCSTHVSKRATYWPE